MNKIKEAIKSMNNLDELISITESEHESVRMAISALEKQIPKKPIEEQGISPRCPYCENANYLTNEDGEENNCCGNCGQALDWGNEDE